MTRKRFLNVATKRFFLAGRIIIFLLNNIFFSSSRKNASTKGKKSHYIKKTLSGNVFVIEKHASQALAATDNLFLWYHIRRKE